MPADSDTVVIAGGGIAGLTLALTCNEIGVPALVLESVREVKPLGVGINLQPNAVRELLDLGLERELSEIGVEAKEWALVDRNGDDVWSEPRGLAAGYKWPQYSVHRGRLQMLLYETVLHRLGPESIQTGCRVQGYQQQGEAVEVHFERRGKGSEVVQGAVMIACDGLHSAVRQQMHPDQGEPHWGGAILWRGTALGRPIRTGASFTLIGSLEQRFVHYPISKPDPATGLQVQNWIAELKVDADGGWGESSWNKEVDVNKFLPAFENWKFDWLDVPAMIRSAETVWEFPMVDRNPVDRWVEGNVVLAGDAAHVMYPVGSNGASQAIVDARVLGAKFIEHGVGREALLSYESALLDDMSALALRNRGDGPVAALGFAQDRSRIEVFMADYKAAAGFAIDTLNAAPPTVQGRVH